MKHKIPVHPEAVFYIAFLDNPEVRNRLDTVEKCNKIIDSMETAIPHDQLPQCYDWLVARRNRLEEQSVVFPAGNAVSL